MATDCNGQTQSLRERDSRPEFDLFRCFFGPVYHGSKLNTTADAILILLSLFYKEGDKQVARRDASVVSTVSGERPCANSFS